jgi:hypothetical protein
MIRHVSPYRRNGCITGCSATKVLIMSLTPIRSKTKSSLGLGINLMVVGFMPVVSQGVGTEQIDNVDRDQSDLNG